MSDHKFILQPYKGPSSRHICPGCSQRHKFSRYVDSTTGDYLADHVGRCDRENSCGYHFTPQQFFKDNPELAQPAESNFRAPEKEIITRPVDTLSFDLMDRSVSKCGQCNLFPFLDKLFKERIAGQLCRDYFIGSNKEGNTVFWQVDIAGKVRQAKIMQYDSVSGHRNKETGAVFAGKKILNNPEANLQQCFFGEFLLSLDENKGKKIAIVESEKTAVITSIYYPEFIWLATGGKNGAKWTEASVCKVLSGKTVILFPDLGAFNSWTSKGLLMASVAGCKVVVSDLLEKNATQEDKEKGLDLVDYLLQAQDSTGLALTDFQYPVIWDYQNRSALQEV